MANALESIANIFDADLSGKSVDRDKVAQSGDFDETPLFNTSAMEGEDSDGPDPEEQAAGRKQTRSRVRKPDPEKDEDESEENEESTPKSKKRQPGEIDADEDEGEIGGDDDEEDDEPSARKKAKTEEDDDDEEEAPSRRGNLDYDEEVEIKVDGERIRVPLREALEGYTRTKTFHQRLNAVEQEKQVVAQDRANYATVLVQQQQALNTLLEEIKSLQPVEPNWADLFEKDPINGAKQKAYWDSFKDQRAALEKAAQNNHQQRVAEYQRGLAEHRQVEYKKIVDHFPHWKDDSARERDQAAMKKTAMKAGFSEAEVMNVNDSRLVMILMKAARYDRLSSKKLKPVQSSTRPMPSGSGAARRGTISQESMRRKAHARRGSLDTAAGVFETMLEKEG